MKIQKLEVLLLSLLLSLSLTTANAENISSSVNDISNAARLAISPQEGFGTDDQSVTNSLLNLAGTIAPDVKWLMIVIRKNNFKEQLTLPVNNGLYQTRISLQDGPGVYDIGLYINKSTERYTSYFEYKKFTVENTDSRDMSFLLPTQKVQVDDPRIKALVENLTKNARDDEEAFLAIYKYITSTIKYDHASLNDGSYVSKDYNAINTLLNSMAVCEGYSNLLAAMSRAYGIRTKVIFGQAKISSGDAGHAWNEVFIHDEWKVVDSTWDAGLKNQKYLFMNPEKFALDHKKEMEMPY